ncbi:MAG: (E)-4-hydroxy-3-methylbut-2-enyl-diphosphate synthase [Bacteroidales bacterium]|jgi:(E)-4-hydroxy-3-methylbut-2-enyl-diphosphate synthase|nr:(E)-4-hydroxy-3-methylbut-2-enyl-diphosphate synthase [Bacteroidales bacterium]
MQFSRFSNTQVSIGTVRIGSKQPIALQSMTNTDTNDIDASVAQCIRIFNAGAQYVRLTAQGVKEAESLKLIREQLRVQGYSQPLVADIHFNPQAALVAAQYVEKVRINPGNYCTTSLKKTDYSDEEYAQELQKIQENLMPLLNVCKQHNTAIRIGVNHGSLSQRIVSRYGDTPLGMAMSMMEFVQICKHADFQNVVCSIKSSNTRLMVYATRLLVQFMKEQHCEFPIHVGVTEAGAGEDGRIKSAVGIGTLLLDGIGDTIRVSLTEAPEKEIPVCQAIVNHTNTLATKLAQRSDYVNDYAQRFLYEKYPSHNVDGIGGDAAPVVISGEENCGADWTLGIVKLHKGNKYVLSPSIYEQEIDKIKESTFNKDCVLQLVCSDNICNTTRKLYARMAELHMHNPVILHAQYAERDFQKLQIQAAIDCGAVFIDGLCDGLMISAPEIAPQKLVELSFSILQAARARFSKTEYISCPSCGRTLFDIEQALADVKARTAHFQGLKIAVMGCVVNGPGEMADADFGYVGAGRGQVNLYKKQTLVHKNIPEHEAVDLLLHMIEEGIHATM